jgi:hypothetical protein
MSAMQSLLNEAWMQELLMSEGIRTMPSCLERRLSQGSELVEEAAKDGRA